MAAAINRPLQPCVLEPRDRLEKKARNLMPPPPRKPRFQTFQRPKTRVAKISTKGKVYVDYKDVESLKKMLSINGKILPRKRSGASAAEQRMITDAIKRSRFLGMLPYVGGSPV
jgi:small subunit ribosomal protein S18